MKKIRIFAGVLAASLASAALYAAPPMNGNGTVTKAAAMAQADKRFAKMDINSDGKLDAADKAAKVQQRFAKIDADKNGSVSEAEFIAMHDARAEKRENRRSMRGERRGPDGQKGYRMGGRGKGGGTKMLSMADSNGDKAITQSEFRAAAEARFARVDTNKDGSITADERRTQRKGKWGNRSSVPADAS